MKVRESVLKTETKSPKLLVSPHFPARRSVLLLCYLSASSIPISDFSLFGTAAFDCAFLQERVMKKQSDEK